MLYETVGYLPMRPVNCLLQLNPSTLAIISENNPTGAMVNMFYTFRKPGHANLKIFNRDLNMAMFGCLEHVRYFWNKVSMVDRFNTFF